MREKEFYKLQQTCKHNDIKLDRKQYLRGYIYYINGKRQKNITELYKTLVKMVNA